MKPASPEQVLFAAALQCATPEARAACLAGACGTDTALRRRVEALLRAAESAGDFLEHPPAGLAASDGSTTVVTALSEKPGDRIGRYKLLQQIGEGGCGVVYMAEQEEPVRRRVALKVIKLGMDTKSVIARFEAERQALALMDHPNIAKVFDAGATDTGRLYFVMELVRGIKITDFCDENKVSTEERLKLFILVCQAIQHAHQKGVIHRDIKPSNILVTVNDGVPVPKVIDFGIVKATGQRLTDKTLFTQFHSFIGTPAYISPEQAEMSSVDIDTRSDIYSLGVLLYELLTGRTPFDGEALLRSGLDEMRRIIRDEQPSRPSIRLDTLGMAEATELSAKRHASVPELAGDVRGDLDWVVMKCLEKDRSRRYETANGLAADIERHLSNEPVVARPPSTGYRFQKAVRRHRLAFAAASAITAALVVGLGISTWMFFKAQVEKEKAQTEAAKATAISDFLQQMLHSANPDALKGSEYTVRQQLDDFSAGLANKLKDQPEVEAVVRATIGRAYDRLGLADKAQPHQERVLTLRRRIFGEQADQVAESLVDLSWTCFEQGQFAKGEPYAREALAIYRKHSNTGQPIMTAMLVLHRLLIAQDRFAEVDALTEELSAIARKSPGVEYPEIASMTHGLADVKNRQGRYVEAEPLARKAVEMHRRLRGAEHPEVGWALLSLGVALRGQQKLNEAEAVLREALGIFRKYYSFGNKSVDMTMAELRLVLEAKGDSAGLEALARERFADANKRIERNDAGGEAWIERALGHADLKLWKAATADSAEAIARSRDANLTTRAAIGVNCLVLAQRAFAAAQSEAAEQASQQAIALFKQLVQENPQVIVYPQHLGHSQWQLGQALQNTGRPDQAEQAFLEALQVFEKGARDFPAEPYFRLEQAASHRLIGDVVNAPGRVDEAVRHYRAAIDLYAALAADLPQNPEYRRRQADTTWVLAGMLERAGRPDTAATEFRRAIVLFEKAIAYFPNDAALKSQLVDLLRGQGRLADAEPVLQEVLAQQRKMVGSEHLDVATSLSSLSFLLREEGKLPESETTAREALAIRKKLLGNEHADVAQSLHLLAWNLHMQGKQNEAEALSREELAMWRKLLGNEHPNVAWALGDLTIFLRDQGKLAEAETSIRESLAIRRKVFGNEHPDVAASFNLLSDLLRAQGELAELEALYREELAMRRKLFGNEHRSVEESLAALAKVLHQEGKLAEAEAVWREELAVERKLSGDAHPFVANSLQSLGAVLRDSGKSSEAEALFREALGMRRKLLGNDNPAVATSLSWLGAILSDQGRNVEAEAIYREALALRRKLPADDPQLAAALAGLTRTLLAVQKFAEAEPLARECLSIREKKLSDDWQTFNARSLLGGSLLGQKKYAEAEPLLLSGYEGMKQREDKIPVASKRYMKETLQRLVQLYEATGQSDKATEWKTKLAGFDQAESEKQAAVTRP